MYGMIHRAMREMLVEEIGEAGWTALEQQLGIGPAELLSQSVYDDAVTLKIVAGAAERLGLPVEECLERFGRYWIRFAERSSYGAIMNFTGRSLEQFIENLDRMHQAVLAAMPEAKVPSFAVLDQQDGQLRVRYQSERTGLEPFVIGLLHGLLERFGMTGHVELSPGRGNAAEFLIKYHAIP